MTYEDFSRLYDEVPLTFSDYYKFTFTFAGHARDHTFITAKYGGEPDRIYKMKIIENDVKTLRHSRPYYIKAERGGLGGEVIFEQSF